MRCGQVLSGAFAGLVALKLAELTRGGVVPEKQESSGIIAPFLYPVSSTSQGAQHPFCLGWCQCIGIPYLPGPMDRKQQRVLSYGSFPVLVV